MNELGPQKHFKGEIHLKPLDYELQACWSLILWKHFMDSTLHIASTKTVCTQLVNGLHIAQYNHKNRMHPISSRLQFINTCF
jgi:hypothetical protein